MENVNTIAKKCNVSRATVYYVAKKLGRLPTESEVNARNTTKGRKPKYVREAQDETSDTTGTIESF